MVDETSLKSVYDAFAKLVGSVDWVLGVGIGGTRDNPKVVVLVKNKADRVKAESAIATMAAVSDIVEIMEVGDIVALPFFRKAFSSKTGEGGTKRVRPLEAGTSIGDHETPGACTATGVFTDGSKYYVLTNAHCLKGAITCRPEDMFSRKLIQPALIDGGDPVKDVVGVTVGASDIFSTGSTDVAVAELVEGIEWSNKIYGTERELRGIGDAEIGDTVFKAGRTTGLTSGRVLLKNVTVGVQYPCFRRIVTNVVMTEKISEPGDSGSPVFKGDVLVGQVFAGNEMISLYTPINLILDETGLKPTVDERKPGSPPWHVQLAKWFRGVCNILKGL